MENALRFDIPIWILNRRHDNGGDLMLIRTNHECGLFCFKRNWFIFPLQYYVHTSIGFELGWFCLDPPVRRLVLNNLDECLAILVSFSRLERTHYYPMRRHRLVICVFMMVTVPLSLATFLLSYFGLAFTILITRHKKWGKIKWYSISLVLCISRIFFILGRWQFALHHSFSSTTVNFRVKEILSWNCLCRQRMCTVGVPSTEYTCDCDK